jgi:hypothetical protein
LDAVAAGAIDAVADQGAGVVLTELLAARGEEFARVVEDLVLEALEQLLAKYGHLSPAHHQHETPPFA